MKRIFVIFSLLFMFAGPVMGASELSKINAQIKQTEQQNQKLEQQVKTSDREISKTKKELVRAADKVSSLEDKRSEMAKKIADLDSKLDELTAEMQKYQDVVSESAASILFVAMHPNFDTENMRDYVLMSAVLSGAADKLNAQIKTAENQIQELEKTRNARAIEKEKLDRTLFDTQKQLGDLKNVRESLMRATVEMTQEQAEEKVEELSNKLRDLNDKQNHIRIPEQIERLKSEIKLLYSTIDDLLNKQKEIQGV